ncbi:putative Acetolactate synthase large subunit [Sterolibacterium denitrificans]|uniref:Acetolactate synthase large subunit n=1 Tax=Sterolibacterium denitrificans TaxID=157592 RepID=A0A7Z7MV24_9PROT|nr:thiamine pyrophosphate-binding protein [Sterolibacterium denitrificans]SMB25543.1 putative Acetolactate synthase large subunit [Sterolibacterium denitrificans]
MKKTGAWLAVHALEQLGIQWTFGIPGMHTTELYDELAQSATITPLLVTHEGCASFMADAVSRTSPEKGIGVLLLVPAAGLTHAASGIGEARLAGIPMLILSGGIRTDLGKRYQLHEIDQLALAGELTKAAFRVLRHEDVVPTIFEAHRIAISGEPGPVLVELPVNLQLLPGEISELPRREAFAPPPPPAPDIVAIREAADLLRTARKPALYVGWGARHAVGECVALAEMLQMPVATTLQGLAAFPADHPLHAGFGFGASAVPAARNAFKDCDCLLAVGARFAEVATGSYGIEVPQQLIHIDINPAVFDANYPARIKIAADARAALRALGEALRSHGLQAVPASESNTARAIVRDKQAYRAAWLAHDSRGRVNPARFFEALRRQSADDAITVVDDGNHTYLTAELFPIHGGGQLILPTDFNAMGYAVPAAIGARLANPQREVFAIVGDGAFLMTCMELANAAARRMPLVIYVFRDGELAQISQAQELPYNRKPCTQLPPVNLEGVALATGAAYVALPDDARITEAITTARELAAAGRPVIVDVAIDYSKRSAFTLGVLKTNLGRLPFRQRVRMVARAVKRRIGG